MSIHAALLLATATFIFVMTPGPGIFAIVSRALSLGAASAIALSLGLIAADFVYLSMAVGGLAFMAERFHWLFVAVKIVGGVYLIWLGLRTWRMSPRPMDETLLTRRSRWREFLTGFLVSSSNPKVIVFYIGFLPTFVDFNQMTPERYGCTAAIVVTTLFVGCVIYTALCLRVRRLFASAKGVSRLNRTSGAVLMGAGVVVATS